MYFGTASQANCRRVPGPGGACLPAAPVGGGGFDLDPQGKLRLITGTFAEDHTRQHLGKAKFVYELAPSVRATYLAGLWTNLSDYQFTSLLKNAAGFPIFNTVGGQQITAGGLYFNAPAGFNPGHANSAHLMQALSVKRDTGGVFDFDIVGTSYNFLRENSHFQNAYGVSPNGRNTVNSGTYWRTIDARAIWRPDHDLLGKHEVSFGAHADAYSLSQAQTNAPVFPSNFYTSI